jgi:lipoyl(octanoyl) transferase
MTEPTTMMRTADQSAGSTAAIEWMISDSPVDYDDALDVMARRVTAIRNGEARELVWLLEHPPLYTAGTSAKEADLLDPNLLPIHRTGRGGQFTYHGPGQRVVYVMLDLKLRGMDVRAFVTRMEQWAVAVLTEFNVKGETRRDRAGVWIKRPSEIGGTEDKIAAIGLRVSRWVSSHGMSINVDPDLSYFNGIVPCGIRDAGVTSLADLGLPVTMHDIDVALRRSFQQAWGPARLIEPGEGVAPTFPKRSARA